MPLWSPERQQSRAHQSNSLRRALKPKRSRWRFGSSGSLSAHLLAQASVGQPLRCTQHVLASSMVKALLSNSCAGKRSLPAAVQTTHDVYSFKTPYGLLNQRFYVPNAPPRTSCTGVGCWPAAPVHGLGSLPSCSLLQGKQQAAACPASAT
jgi:hypothetical protein